MAVDVVVMQPEDKVVSEQNITPDSCLALTVYDLVAGYPGQPRAIYDVSFSVDRGERVAIIGPNGAGKSTLFKTLVGLIPHSAGRISLHGEDCRTSHTLIGYVPQYEGIDWDFPVTVRDVVMMGRTRKIGLFHWPGKHDWKEVDAALDQVDMLGFAKRQIGQLSGGQRRRVFIARALAQETDVLLLDEPFNGVDVTAEQDIMKTLDRLQEQAITVILATHDLHLATTRFDRLMLFNRHVVAYGDPTSVFTAEVLRETYGGRAGIFQTSGNMVFVADEHN